MPAIVYCPHCGAANPIGARVRLNYGRPLMV